MEPPKQPDNILHQAEEGYQSVGGFSHKQQGCALVPAYSFQLYISDGQGLSERLHWLQINDAIQNVNSILKRAAGKLRNNSHKMQGHS